VGDADPVVTEAVASAAPAHTRTMSFLIVVPLWICGARIHGLPGHTGDFKRPNALSKVATKRAASGLAG
jgi:hypothetical protein